jgi:hypothetical protein
LARILGTAGQLLGDGERSQCGSVQAIDAQRALRQLDGPLEVSADR